MFEKRPSDFTNVQIPGVLVYWHLPKRHCADRKLGPTCGVGIYIGPADAVRQSGHQVYTLDGCVISTPFVIPDSSVYPFDQGLQQMLAQISSSTLDALPKELEPSSLVLNDGVDATSLIGAEVRRKFPSGWFNGRVVQVFPDPNYPDVLLFKVVYEDNNDEVMTYESLTKILVNRAFSADRPSICNAFEDSRV